MAHYMENQTVNLGNVHGEDLYYRDDVFHVLSAVIVIIPGYVSFSKNVQWIVIVHFGWLNVLITSYMRCTVYKYLFDQYKAKELTPINVLILAVYIIQHIGSIVFQVHETVIVWSNSPLQDIAGPWICTPLRVFFLFEFFYSVIGGLGIAIYRILLIKHDKLVKDVIGGKNLLYIILFSGILISFCLACLFHFGGEQPTCMMAPKLNILQIVDAYEQSIGNTTMHNYLILVRTAIFAILLVLTSAEIIIYITFFHHMYKHDNNERLRRLLGSNAIKHRNRKNALTFFSQFCSFVLEGSLITTGIFTLWFGSSKNQGYLICNQLKKITFSGAVIIEVLTSSNLRRKVFLPFGR
jgi:hypothetical protein